ncbi:uncharacterized protein LOC105920624 [Fundulus heteroclitus]|uniref:uncharacterized protein LOC105920624 n=1 Tax=Fundulus heteroclitus TaxID=8078 RepID=UPI00165BCCA9|nr:uncharacterized protein LOC105920624 [Fundulus heteroclitus]XP_035998549.1 uncharacterized protein LOC105920624 [Fundulus heteroclitus]
MLIYSQSPLYSIEKIQSLDEKTSVSIEGTVAEIKPEEEVKLKRKRTKEKLQKFQLRDETRSIWITLWRKDTEQLRGTSVGDFVRVINLKTNWYHKTLSLNSTDYTRIYKVQSAAVQNVTVKIEGVIKAGGMESELEVEINHQLNTFIMSSRLLADALGIKLQGDFEDKLLEMLPFTGKAEIQGNRILKLQKKSKPMRI